METAFLMHASDIELRAHCGAWMPDGPLMSSPFSEASQKGCSSPGVRVRPYKPRAERKSVTG